ncbi:cysteine desulfurase sulfur acceptor subunit CsdE [Vibrio sp. dsl-7]|uniref:Cysteine desulfurase sulfur acceptor subunit CsdE n=1 Tax=Vibrio chanodichtyis TaxID=3027932 RepID=A0ABT5UZL1_9VIBR|nr:cysteine desulfurase sulfur acceptor subunit CsdE [Vibrio chanodichtyis]MDE1514856.1 cysteine desulfurase sulfur acceptor subunit CsdE [Vibrio chanodichtyis]
MSPFTAHPFGDAITAQTILETLQTLHGWENRYRQIIQWGKLLPVIPDALKSEQVLVSGCESEVWLVAERQGEQWFFCADSDARIVRGLIAIVLAALNGKTSAQIRAFSMDDYFAELGLLTHLSPSRGNGLQAIVASMQAKALN